MPELLTFDDVSELSLSALSGTRYSNRSARRARVSVQVQTASSDDDPHAASLTATVKVSALSDDETDDDDDGESLYEGSAGYYVALVREYNEASAPDLVRLTWPYLRGALIEHSSRLQAKLKLPLTLTDEELASSQEPLDSDTASPNEA